MSLYNSPATYEYTNYIEPTNLITTNREFQFLDKNGTIVSRPQYNTEYRIRSYYYSSLAGEDQINAFTQMTDGLDKDNNVTKRAMYINSSKAYITVSPPDGINPLYVYNSIFENDTINANDYLQQNVIICTPPDVLDTGLKYISLNGSNEEINGASKDQTYIDYINTQYARCSTTFKFIKPV